MSKKKLDLILLERGLARSRSHAQQLIRDNLVKVEGEIITVSPDAQYVSRGSLKLIPALDKIGLVVQNLTCLDIGISTGGFSQVLLERGAKLVVGVDVGKDQLSPQLKQNSKLKYIEGINARNLRTQDVESFAKSFDLLVMDVSFISISLVLPPAVKLLDRQGHALILIKPQFELGPSALNKKGVVKEPSLYSELEVKIRKLFVENKLEVLNYFECDIKGGDGNIEFFCYAKLKDL